MDLPMPASVALNSVTHLFVYGTLAPGERNAHIMKGMDGQWRPATVNGYKFITVSGVHKGLPGFHPDPAGPTVSGLVFSSDDLPKHWKRLDAFEGSHYQRCEIAARLGTDEEITVCIYETIERV